MRRQWKTVPEMDLEDGTSTEWSLKVAEGEFYWIDETSDGTFDVIAPDGHTVMMNCKSLASAKRWVTRNLIGG